MTLYTKQNLDKLWKTLDYAEAVMSSSISEVCYGKVHPRRAHQSMEYLKEAIELVNQMQEELKDD